jgi:hypothetical protein
MVDGLILTSGIYNKNKDYFNKLLVDFELLFNENVLFLWESPFSLKSTIHPPPSTTLKNYKV